MSDTPTQHPPAAPRRVVQGEKLRGAEKMARIPIKIEPTATPAVDAGPLALSDG